LAARALLYEDRQDQLVEAVSWSLQGRLAVRNDQDGGSGSFRWLEQPQNTQMDFHGALGRGAWRLVAEPAGVVLERADGSSQRAGTIGELVQGELGWAIPVDALSWWVRGLAAPGEVERRMLNETGSLAELQQLDWTIEYGRYRSFQGLELPVKMTARRQDVSVKLAVKDWDLSWEAAPDD
jgi:outer membrane lipoprotein LolB